MKGFWKSFAIAFALAALAVGVLATRYTLKNRKAVSVGWNPRTILVASADLAQDRVLNTSDVIEMEVPEQFVSESNVPADDHALLVGQRLLEPVSKGAVIVWSMFGREDQRRLDACLASVEEAAVQGGRRAADDSAAEFAKLKRKFPAPGDVPQPVASAGGIAIVVVTREVREGELIEAGALGSRVLPEAMFTASYVPADQREKIAGARAIRPLDPGDPVLWQLLDDPARPQSVAACRSAAEGAESKARAETAKALATEFFAREAR